MCFWMDGWSKIELTWNTRWALKWTSSACPIGNLMYKRPPSDSSPTRFVNPLIWQFMWIGSVYRPRQNAQSHADKTENLFDPNPVDSSNQLDGIWCFHVQNLARGGRQQLRSHDRRPHVQQIHRRERRYQYGALDCGRGWAVRPTSLDGNNGHYLFRQCRRNLTGCETRGLLFRLVPAIVFISVEFLQIFKMLWFHKNSPISRAKIYFKIF